MKMLDIKKAKASLGEYAAGIHDDLVVITKSGRPLAALVSLGNSDMETIALSTNQKFLRLIERSRKSYRSRGGIAASQIRKLVRS